MKVQTLHEFTDERFLSELDHLKKESFKGDQRNFDWFDHLAKVYNTKFMEWFFLVDDTDDLCMFATIQEFYPKCYRLLTRTYIHPKYRRPILPKNDTFRSPSMYILEEQLKYIDNEYETLFISMQDITRRKSLERYKQKLDGEWKLHSGMVQTCATQGDKDCWQNVIYKGIMPKLNSITTNQWKNLYDQR